MTMIQMPTAQECNKTVYSDEAKEIIPYEIFGEILKAAGMQVFHADWYSGKYREQEHFEKAIEAVTDVVDCLRELGYKCTLHEFEPSSSFPDYRLRLHINWE